MQMATELLSPGIWVELENERGRHLVNISTVLQITLKPLEIWVYLADGERERYQYDSEAEAVKEYEGLKALVGVRGGDT